ncbi:MAG: DUF421 domain-containing protein [Planctomycetia bacterium]|nr:DUF421 domain-containing protein [Planctomycetia bacterium]
MWELSVAWWELILRGVLTYFLLLLLLRLTGKRQIGQLAPFDLVLLLVLSNAVQNAMNGGDNSYTAGVVSAVTLVALNYGIGLATFRWKWMERMVEGKPTLLVHNGRIDERALRHEQLTHHELMSALRRAGCTDVAQVHVAILENDGQITVLPFRNNRDLHDEAKPRAADAGEGTTA